MTQHRIGVYPGTFDPVTNGHFDIIMRGAKIVDELIIAVSESRAKAPLFSLADRCDMIKKHIQYIGSELKISVKPFDGLLVDFCKKEQASLIIRGLRAVSDFEYEFQMSCMNSRLSPEIETIFMPSSEKNQFISSRLVKEIASLRGNISDFVCPYVEEHIRRIMV